MSSASVERAGTSTAADWRRYARNCANCLRPSAAVFFLCDDYTCCFCLVECDHRMLKSMTHQLRLIL